MTKTAAAEYAHQNIRVNAVAPGPIRTPMMGFIADDPRTSREAEKMVNRVPLGRYGEAEEVAGLIAFLLGGESSYVSGSVMTVDGAMMA